MKLAKNVHRSFLQQNVNLATKRGNAHNLVSTSADSEYYLVEDFLFTMFWNQQNALSNAKSLTLQFAGEQFVQKIGLLFRGCVFTWRKKHTYQWMENLQTWTIIFYHNK